jgi:chorismate synthase
MGNSFGTLFRISSWGESHGGGIGVVIDGCPPQLPLCEKDIQPFLDRRRPGQSKLTTPRDESDQVEILSGVFEGKTLGTPIALLVRNKDARPQAYDEMKEKFRPSHADFTYQTKFGHRNHEGGGRSSARETIARVASGAIAQKILSFDGVFISTYVERIHDIEAPKLSNVPTLEEIEASPTRCPHPETASKMEARVLEAKKAGDSVGGSVLCRVNGLPVGWGAPVFDRLEADLAKAMLSLPATKGFEVGSGFQGTYLKGSEHNTEDCGHHRAGNRIDGAWSPRPLRSSPGSSDRGSHGRTGAAGSSHAPLRSMRILLLCLDGCPTISTLLSTHPGAARSTS